MINLCIHRMNHRIKDNHNLTSRLKPRTITKTRGIEDNGECNDQQSMQNIWKHYNKEMLKEEDKKKEEDEPNVSNSRLLEKSTEEKIGKYYKCSEEVKIEI